MHRTKTIVLHSLLWVALINIVHQYSVGQKGMYVLTFLTNWAASKLGLPPALFAYLLFLKDWRKFSQPRTNPSVQLGR